jgi:hypothetical protein
MMEFLDEEDRRGAMRQANRAFVRAALAFVSLVLLAPLVTLYVTPVFGLAASLIAVVLGASSIPTLRHPQAKVIGALRVVGLVLASLVLLVGALELVAIGLQYKKMRDDAEMIDRANRRVRW